MFAKPQAKIQPGYTGDQQVFSVAGVLLEFLTSPNEVRDAICFIRGTIPPGVVLPLHSHADPELVYVLEGALEVFRSNLGSNEWTTVGQGKLIAIPGSVKHALRNSSSGPVKLAVVTKSELYEFFRAVAKPFDPNQSPAPPTPEGTEALFQIAAKYGYWIASPEENAAIGLSIT